MGIDGETIAIKADLRQTVAMPDGKLPLPLGSGSIAGILGMGGMSNVYKIWNPQMERYRAVKLMKPDISMESRQRFQTEIKITAALSHPNIIEIHSVGEWNALSYIEMEYIEGATLADYIEKRGALPLQVCTALGILMARALVYAHAKEYVLFGKMYCGLIHRDLKPSNLMIGNDGRVKLMDFGIARPVETSLLTMDGEVMGTMQYLSPEQIDGKNVGVAADLYALGEILYETITGHKAFPQKNLSQLMSVKTANIFVPLNSFRIRIPGRLKNLIQQCMRRDPDKRPESAVKLLEELESIHQHYSSETAEQIVARFVKSAADVRTIYFFRRPLPNSVRTVAAIIALLVGSAAVFIYVQSLPRRLPSRTEIPLKELEKTGAPKQPSAPALQPVTPQKTTEPAAPQPKALSRSRPIPAEEKADSSYYTAKSNPEGIRKTTDGGNSLEAFIKETEAGNYTAALEIFEKLPRSDALEKTAQIVRLRALYALGKTADASRTLDNLAMDDGELFLIKARMLIDKGETSPALQCLEKSVQTGALLIEAGALRRDYLYYRAVCMTRQYEESPTEERRNNALDGWFEVKNSLRKYPDHAYFKKAVSEMQKIANSVIPSKG